MDTKRKFISDFNISSDHEVSEESLIADIANAENRIKELCESSYYYKRYESKPGYEDLEERT